VTNKGETMIARIRAADGGDFANSNQIGDRSSLG